MTAVVMTAVFFSGCAQEPSHASRQHQLPAATVRVQKVQAVQEPVFEQVMGTIRADKRAILEAKISGRIENMPVLLGQRVKAGEVVALLDAAEIQARFDQANASLEQAQREWKRMSALFEQQATTRADYETAESRLRLAEANIAEARAMMNYVQIIAPFDGVITRKFADEGDFASPGKPLLGLEDPSLLLLEADIPEGVGSELKPGGALTVQVDAMNKTLEGTIREIAPIADPETRTVRVKVQLPTAAGLRPGQFARLLVPIREVEHVRVPRSALVERGQLEMIFVAEENRAKLHLVKTGSRHEGRVDILAGVNPGDTVVVEGAALLRDGQPLVIQ